MVRGSEAARDSVASNAGQFNFHLARHARTSEKLVARRVSSVARISSIVVGIATVAALIVALRLYGSSLLRFFRSEDDHPHWELLMQ